MIIQGIAISRVRRTDFRGNVITNIFRQPTLGSPTNVAWRRVLLPDIGSSSHHLDSEQHYLSRHSIEISMLSLRPYWKMNGGITWLVKNEWRYNVTCDLSKLQDVVWVFGFNQYEYESVLRLTPKHWGFRRECQSKQCTASKFIEEGVAS